MITTSCRGRASTRLVAGGTIRLGLAGRFTGWLNVFALLSFVVFAFIAGGDLLCRVLTRCRVQPEPLLRLGNTVVIYLRGEGAGVGVVGNRRSPLDDSWPRRLQLRVGLLPPGGQLVQTQLGIPGLGELQRPPGAGPSRRSLPGLEAANATSSQLAVRLGVRGTTSPGQRAASTCAPTR